MTDEQVQSQPGPQPEGDLSKRTMVMLVILSCLVSLVGTVAMVYQLTTSSPAPVTGQNSPQANAEVGFTITAPPEPKTSGATGFATFAIGE